MNQNEKSPDRRGVPYIHACERLSIPERQPRPGQMLRRSPIHRNIVTSATCNVLVTSPIQHECQTSMKRETEKQACERAVVFCKNFM